MAEIVTDTVVINFSKLVKTGNSSTDIVGIEVIAALEQVAQELVGDSVIVEVVKA